jgi:O-antigen ligase
LGLFGIVLLIPFLGRFIPRAEHGLNAETPLFMLALLVVLARARPPLPSWKVLAPFAAYYGCVLFGFAMLAARYSAEQVGMPLFAWAETMKSDLWPTLLFFIAFALAPNPRDRRMIFACMIVGAFVYAVSGLIDYFGGPQSFMDPAGHRAVGVLAVNPNHLGGHLAAVSVLPLMAALRRGSSFAVRATCAVVYGVSLLALALTQSRGSWLGFLAGHAVWLAFANRKLLAPVVVALSLALLIGYSWSLLPSAVSSRIEETFSPSQKIYATGGLAGKLDSSVGLRIALYKMGGEMFLDSPVWGHGFRGFRFLTNEYGPKYGAWNEQGWIGLDSESLILTVAVDNGVIGLAVLAWLGWTLLSRALVLARTGEAERDVGIVFLSVCAAVGFESLTQNALNVHEISLPFWLTAGLMVRASREMATSEARAPARSVPTVGRLEARA